MECPSSESHGNLWESFFMIPVVSLVAFLNQSYGLYIVFAPLGILLGTYLIAKGAAYVSRDRAMGLMMGIFVCGCLIMILGSGVINTVLCPSCSLPSEFKVSDDDIRKTLYLGVDESNNSLFLMEDEISVDSGGSRNAPRRCIMTA